MADKKRHPNARLRANAQPDVLFLDYDNCLHRCDAHVSDGKVVASEPGVALFEFAEILERELRPYPAVRTVLSTDWVQVLGFERARDTLPLTSLRDRVVDSTRTDDSDEREFSSVSRGEQIRRYLVKHQLRSWVAIDDRHDGFEPFRARLVRCQPGVGLGDSVVQELLTLQLRATFHVEWDWG